MRFTCFRWAWVANRSNGNESKAEISKRCKCSNRFVKKHDMDKLRGWLPIVATLIAGGLAGSIFTWWVNHPRNTVIGYNITTATVGAGPEVKSLVPGLRIEINNRDVPIFYVNDMSFSVQGGPGEDSVRVGVFFPDRTQIYGTSTQAPTPLHRISCVPLNNPYQFACTFGRLNPDTANNKFRFEVATDQKGPITVTTDSNKVSLVSLDELLKSQSEIIIAGITIPSSIFVYFSFICAFGVIMEFVLSAFKGHSP